MTPNEEQNVRKEPTLSEILIERYKPTVVPPCRACGAKLKISSCGGGHPTIWACSAVEPKQGKTKEFYDHYRKSQWEDPRQGGDSDVIEAVEELTRLRALNAQLEEKLGNVLVREGKENGRLLTLVLKLESDLWKSEQQCEGWQVWQLERNAEMIDLEEELAGKESLNMQMKERLKGEALMLDELRATNADLRAQLSFACERRDGLTAANERHISERDKAQQLNAQLLEALKRNIRIVETLQAKGSSRKGLDEWIQAVDAAKNLIALAEKEGE